MPQIDWWNDNKFLLLAVAVAFPKIWRIVEADSKEQGNSPAK
jgi:hypothetical protein